MNNYNPMQMMMQQMFSQVFGNGNPMQNMTNIAKTNSYMAQALKMANNCNNIEELQNVCKNVAREQGIDFNMVQSMVNNIGHTMGMM